MMTRIEKIKSVLSQPNYEIRKGKIWHLDSFGDWCEKKFDSREMVQLKDAKGNVEMFAKGEIKSVLNGTSDLVEMAQEGLREASYSEKEIQSVAVVVPVGKIKKEKVTKKVKEQKPKKSRVALRSDQIKLIRQRVSEEKSINAIAAELGVERFPVMYVVKQIKAGKKLRYE